MRGSAAFRAAVAPSGVLAGPWVRNELWRRARAVPSLDLRFAENKSLVDATTGQNLVTFTRASSGTYVGSDGLIKTATTNEARFDHNPTTGESLGLLVEESRTNLFLRSEEFGTGWTLQNVTLSENTITAPNGTLTADTITDATAASSANHRVHQTTISATAGQVCTASFYVKNINATWVHIRDGSNTLSCWFNISAKTIGTNGLSSTASIQDVGDNWLRIFVTWTPAVASTSVGICFAPANGTSAYTTSTGGSFYLWGAQLEAGASPTSYIPTTTATVTRSADVASISGSNFSSWYRQDEGSAFIDFKINGVIASNNFIYDFSNGTINEEIFLNYQDTGNARWAARVANVQVTQDQSGAGLPRVKHAFGMASNRYMVARDGILSTGSSQVGMPSNTSLKLGARFNDASPSNSTIRRLTYWPQRLPNETLQAVTQ